MTYLSSEVRDHRYEQLRAAMKAADVGAVAISDPDFFFFFTNYVLDVRTWERPIVLLIPATGEPFMVMHELSRNGLAHASERGTLWVTDVTFYAEHPRVSDRLVLRPGLVGAIAEMLRKRGLAAARVGYDTPPIESTHLEDLAPDLQLIPMTSPLRELRWVKTGEEIELARRVGELTDFGQKLFKNGLKVGRYIQELDASIIAKVTEEACRRFPGEDFSMRLHSWSGPVTAAPHGGPRTGLQIAAGDGVVDILTARLNGIEVENERTWFVGKPTKDQQAYFEATHAANVAAKNILIEGNRVCDIDAAAQAVYEDAGYGQHICHRTGHGMGIVRHEFPEDMAFCTRRLMRGEMYSVEPGIYVPGVGGFRQDDTVVVGATSPEFVTNAPGDIANQTVPG